MSHTSERWIQIFSDNGAYWHHDGNPLRPHALLTSGLHSDGFFNWSIIAQHPRISQRAASQLSQQVNLGSFSREINRVVGPAAGAITLAHCMAASGHNSSCKSGFTEKIAGDDSRVSLARFNVQGELVLACEDTITSGNSVRKTITAIEEGGGVVAEVIAAVFNRSGLTEIDGRRISALVEVPMNTWPADECPLCKLNSEAIRPKKDNNWKRLN